MKRLLILLPTLLAVGTASAQTTFRLGLRGGANLARTTVDAANNGSTFSYTLTTTKAAIYAWQAGIASELNFGKIALQPALLLTQKGERSRTTAHFIADVITPGPTFSYFIERTTTSRTNWLELPLNVVYTLHGDHGLQVFAGPYVALAVGGQQHLATSSTFGNSTTSSTDTTSRMHYGPGTGNRRFDAGLNFGLGYRQGPVQVQLSYGLGLVNLHTQGADYPVRTAYYDSYQAYNRALQLTGTYFFHL